MMTTPILGKRTSLQADSKYSNTAVTLIEQSHVYSWLYALTKTKQTSILKI